MKSSTGKSSWSGLRNREPYLREIYSIQKVHAARPTLSIFFQKLFLHTEKLVYLFDTGEGQRQAAKNPTSKSDCYNQAYYKNNRNGHDRNH